MNEKYPIGAEGYFEFTIRKRNKYGEYITPFSGHYRVIDRDARNVTLWDLETELIVTKHRITKFEPKKLPVI